MDPTAHSESRELVIRPESHFSLQHLRDVWDHRELLFILVSRDVRVRYKQAIIGVAWVVLQPIAQLVIYTVLFNRFGGIDSGSDLPYPVFCFSGLVIWSLFSSGLTQASESLVASANLVTKVYFPRVILPMASVGTALVDFLVGFPLVLLLARYFHVPLAATALLAPLLALFAMASALALGLWTSALNLRYRDMRHALPFFIQMLVFLTPVLYPASKVPERLRGLWALNPMAAVVGGFRGLLFGQPIPWTGLGWAFLVILVVGGVGFVRFRALEQTFADRV